ncbi:S-adenosyl-L-methionine-dependent methyltransferase [Xylariales sp. AK1849]|nr:S-adenosyl-L-methionine-dependent methyltransferase [Xylariales sp. AK1849]
MKNLLSRPLPDLDQARPYPDPVEPLGVSIGFNRERAAGPGVSHPVFTGHPHAYQGHSAASPWSPRPSVGSDSYYYTNRGGTIPDPRSVTENGRTYHGYKDGKYFLPNDAIEQDRLDVQHVAWRYYMDGALAWAPISDPHDVLDIGTGTGIWAIEFADQHPNARVIGTDLSQIQPWGRHPNVQWIQEDVEDDWAYFPHPFDYIHLRMMVTSFGDPQSIMRKIYHHLRPGGWTEYQEGSLDIFCQDTSTLGTSIHRWSLMVKNGARALGRDLEVAQKYKEWLMEAGFVNVTERIIQVPGNTWPGDLRLKSMGQWTLADALQGIEGVSLKILQNGIHMSLKDIQTLVTQVKKDINDKKHRFYWICRVVYGQKPAIDGTNP